MLKKVTTLAVALAVASLTGCATYGQVEEQNTQLASINATLNKIHAAQAEAFALQKIQASVQVETHNMQAEQVEQELQRKQSK